MKKVLNFLTNTKNGEKIFLTANASVVVSLAIGLVLSIPMFWMGNKYDNTWMNSFAPYFFYLFFGYAVLILFLFIPYLYYVSTSENYKGSGRALMKGMAIFCSIVPGGFIYSFVAKVLFIPTGPYNIIGMLFFGIIYLWIMKIIFKKPFDIVQEFVPLN